MKLRAVMLMMTILLTICTSCEAARKTTPPMSTELSRLPKPTRSDRLPQGSGVPYATKGFAIYQLTPNASRKGSANVGPSDLEGSPFLSIDDIVSYRWATHEIELTEPAYERTRNLAMPLQGEGFAVCVNRWPVYTGAFWNAYSSSVFEGAFIDLVRPTREQPLIQIRLGYPSPTFFRGEDRRSDPRILQALEEAGKLR